ncbi:MAG: 5'-nucleotidase C-terminal domain-containing protein [Moraxellaceae bacterium]|nr:5'-nucleotidase C-terminal domain-containing protein [Moraxellaceae bacterium]
MSNLFGLAAIYPNENSLYVIRINGKQLREYLEHTSNYYLVNPEAGTPLVNRSWPGYNFDTVNGVEYELDLRKEPGSRLVYLRRNGRAVRNTDTFTMAVNSYRAEGGGGFTMLAGSPVTWRSDVSVKLMLENELSRVDTLRIEDIHTVNWKLRF